MSALRLYKFFMNSLHPLYAQPHSILNGLEADDLTGSLGSAAQAAGGIRGLTFEISTTQLPQKVKSHCSLDCCGRDFRVGPATAINSQ